MRYRVVRKVFILIIIGVCVVASRPPNAHAQSVLLREYQIKAAFLYNFLKFIDWPREAVGETANTMTICVLGDDLVAEAFDSIKGKMVKGRSLAIQRIDSKELTPCHVIFVSALGEKRVPQIIQSIQASSVLTVGEVVQFLQSGGIINFVVEGNKVRFEISLNSAERARLKLSSQLLSLAKVVRQ